MGSGSQLLHEDMESVIVCLGSATSRNYDLVFGEEAKTVDKVLVMDAFPPIYDYIGCALCSSEIGFPMHRERYWFGGINRSTLIYIGPRGPALREAILKIFGRAVHLEADDFLGLSDDQGRTNARRDMASSRCIYGSDEQINALSPLSLLPAGSQRYWKGYRDVLQADRTGVRGSFAADLSQDPLGRPRCGAWFPGFACSSEIASISKEKFFTQAELDMAMGFPSIPSLPGSKAYAECFSDRVTGLPFPKYKKVLGNGVHLPTQNCFLLFVLSHCVRRCDVEAWKPDLHFPSDAVFEKDEDEDD